MLNSRPDAESFFPVDDFVEHPLLRQINWSARNLVMLIRTDIIYGYYDSSLKVWMTSKEQVRKALEHRNRNVADRILDLSDF